jgi:cell division protein FtsB
MLKWLAVVLVVLVALLQYRLWFGVGGLGEFAEVRDRVDALEAQNRPLRARNARLAAEVVDLKTGLDAIEERARSDIGMVRSDEQFYWVPGVTVEASQQEGEDSLPETVPLSTETASLPAEVDR